MIVKLSKILTMCSRRYISILLFLVGLFFSKQVNAQARQGFMVNSYIVVDFHSKKILSARDVNKRMPVASLTKIATSVVVLDWAQAVNADLSANLIVPQTAALIGCLLYTSPSPRAATLSRMPSSA